VILATARASSPAESHDKYPQKFVVVGQVEVDGRSSVMARPWVLPYQAAPCSRTSVITVFFARPVMRFALRA
jgi:hypothetical protein